MSRSPRGRGDDRAPLRLDLFADVSFVAVIDSFEPQGGSALTAIGPLDGIEGSSVILVASAGVVAGSITLPGAQYQIRSASNGAHVMREFDVRQLPRERALVFVDLMPNAIHCPTQWYANVTGVCCEKSSVPWPRSPAKIAGAILEREFGESGGIPRGVALTTCECTVGGVGGSDDQVTSASGASLARPLVPAGRGDTPRQSAGRAIVGPIPPPEERRCE